jgi:signal transduction histidine kinase
MTRLRARRATALPIDRAAIAFVVVVGCVVVLLGEPIRHGPPRSLDGFAAAILVTAVAVLFLRKRWPAAVTVAILGLSILWYTSGYTSRLIDGPALVAFYTLGTTGDRVRQLGVGGLAVGALLVGALVGQEDPRIAIVGVGWTVAVILFGELVHSRRLLLEQSAERAATAEAERDAEAERRVADERLRIARDVHDVLAHTVSVMTVQAGVAADAVDRDLAAVRSALAKVRSAGKEATTEVRATVAVLRGTAPVETTPTPRLDRVTELIEGARAQGLDVDLSIDLDGAGVGSLLELTAYRVVQESLTNVIRHAAASQARVRIARMGSDLVIEVNDDGILASRDRPPTPGFGLRGMGERIEALGGSLSYGPAPGRGWTVRALLPTRTAGS